MTRHLDTATLEAAAEVYRAHLSLPTQRHRRTMRPIGGRDWVLNNLYNATFKDEHELLVALVKDGMAGRSLAAFEATAKDRFTPREDAVFATLLAEKLAVTPDGRHIEGRRGTTQVGARQVGTRITRHGVKPAWWPIYAGEEAERAAGHVRAPGADGAGCDPLPPPGTLFIDETSHMGYGLVLATEVTNISIAGAIAAANGVVDLLDEGTGAGLLRAYSGSQPVDPDAAITGTLAATFVLTDPAFGGAADAAPGATATAAAVADDTSIDATVTVTHMRAWSSNDGATPLNAHIDGNAGTDAEAFIFNTVAFVAGATGSITSWTYTQPQGPTAT